MKHRSVLYYYSYLVTPELLNQANPLHPTHDYVQDQLVSQDEQLSEVNDSEIEAIPLNVEEIEQKRTLLSLNHQNIQTKTNY